ncbi:MAG TPA: tetratricopeptide repeat protein [Burkholderiaceae bacterium]|nr:tetratricopeptide repeat protein [Burkholderiaceae bacterium]
MSKGAQGPFTIRQIQQSLGIPRSSIQQLISAGFVTPRRGGRGEYLFTFQDVVVLRTAHEMREAGVPTRRILAALHGLRARLPETVPLSGLRIQAVGSEVAVRDGASRWEVASGQLLLDFHVEPVGSTVVVVPFDPRDRTPAGDDPVQWVQEGEAIEDEDPIGAEAAYRHALRLDPGYADAYLNLGALLCEEGRCEEALRLFDEAIERCPGDEMLHYNRAVALEGLGRFAEAIASFRKTVELQPAMADAHYHLARLLEQVGDQQGVVRHLNAFRRNRQGK